MSFERDRHGRLTATLRDGSQETAVTAAVAAPAAAALATALADARVGGYGECFWPEPPGHYWWMLHLSGASLEVIVMFSRGGASGWQHVFRSTDDVGWFEERLRTEVERVTDVEQP